MPFRVAISGLRAASEDLNVIGNNVANANTTGFKQSRAEFADLFAVTDQRIVSRNARGNGVQLSRVASQFSQGNISFTDNGLDLALNGQGFFILNDNGGRVYSRAGAFGLDRTGFVVNAQGQQLIAFQSDSSGNITGATGPLQITASDRAPQATSRIDARINLDASQSAPTAGFDPADPTSYNDSTSTTIFDSLGNSHLATTYYRKLGPNDWETYLYVDGVQVDGPDSLQFSTSGALITPAGPGTITTPSFTPSGGGAAMTLTLDYSNTSQFGSPFAVHSLNQDGFTTGRLIGIDIDDQGVIFTRFTNGQSRIEGQLALANFPNPQGLQPLGDTAWAETFSSGDVTVGAPGASNLGLVQSGALEESNVDLAEQLVKMIVAQRNFQANAEVISTADAVTQSIINIR
jgi:flagellar hook protein FlgE